ncbi:tyrosine-type recombinase/integrase [Haloferula sp. A504]|uniref:tyrosine-type recombinase/integrase n=1 Tax=Haloferula sp. A504 TaxID=3373601 RepID=UPI0037C1987C
MKWVVYWPAATPGKPRRYRRFKLKKDAEEFQEQKEIDVQNKGTEAAAVHDEALSELKWAVQVLEPLGVSIREAIQSFVDRRAEIAASVPVSEAIRQFRDSKERDGASERYARDLKLRLAKFEEPFGKKAVCDITVRELDRWLVSLGVGPTSRNNYRRNLGVFFSWCEGMGYCQNNPMRKTSRARKKPQPVEIFSADDLRVILENAPEELLPALAIGGLAGIRVAEISKLDWSEINFDKGHIEVAAENSKTASRRFVPMEPALRAWLKKVARVSGPVTQKRLDERLSEYRKILRKEQKDDDGVVLRPAVHWKDNGLRHSYGSYAIAREESADRVALWMGHTSAAVTFAHYQERATTEEAEAWFGVFPKAEEPKGEKGKQKAG